MWRRAVSAHPRNVDIHRVGAGIRRIGGRTQNTGGHRGCDMERHRIVRLPKTLPQVISPHGCGTHHPLLRGLADQHQSAPPLILLSRH